MKRVNKKRTISYILNLKLFYLFAINIFFIVLLSINIITS